MHFENRVKTLLPIRILTTRVWKSTLEHPFFHPPIEGKKKGRERRSKEVRIHIVISSKCSRTGYEDIAKYCYENRRFVAIRVINIVDVLYA